MTHLQPLIPQTRLYYTKKRPHTKYKYVNCCPCTYLQSVRVWLVTGNWVDVVSRRGVTVSACPVCWVGWSPGQGGFGQVLCHLTQRVGLFFFLTGTFIKSKLVQQWYARCLQNIKLAAGFVIKFRVAVIHFIWNIQDNKPTWIWEYFLWDICLVHPDNVNRNIAKAWLAL